MKTATFNGQCPTCELENNTVTMRYNTAKELECPVCNLRIYTDSKKLALIYRNRGTGNFSLQPAPVFKNPLYYIGADTKYDSYSDGSFLTYHSDVKHYLQHEVQQNASKNLITELINSYIVAFYNDQDMEYYQMISHLANIDIAHAVINDTHTTTKYLFHYLHFVIGCIAEDDFEALDNFPMNTITLKVHNQYIAPYLSILKHDRFLQKVALYQLSHQLIHLIYVSNQVVKK